MEIFAVVRAIRGSPSDLMILEPQKLNREPRESREPREPPEWNTESARNQAGKMRWLQFSVHHIGVRHAIFPVIEGVGNFTDDFHSNALPEAHGGGVGLHNKIEL